MGSEQILSSGFYIWWLCLNSFLFFAEFQFIQNFAGARTQCADCEPGPGVRRALYVLLSGLLTLLVMYAQSSGVFRLFLHTGIILCFSRFILKIKWPYTIGPAMIILTLFTFMEGFLLSVCTAFPMRIYCMGDPQRTWAGYVDGF